MKWHSSKYSDPYSEFVLRIYPSNVHTHSSEHTHKPWTHSQSSGQPFMLRLLGRSWGFGALLKGTSVVEKALYINSPHLQVLLARDSNSQPFDYESDFLTIRPRLSVGFKPKKAAMKARLCSVSCKKPDKMRLYRIVMWGKRKHDIQLNIREEKKIYFLNYKHMYVCTLMIHSFASSIRLIAISGHPCGCWLLTFHFDKLLYQHFTFLFDLINYRNWTHFSQSRQ